jgi:hypothetical protein
MYCAVKEGVVPLLHDDFALSPAKVRVVVHDGGVAVADGLGVGGMPPPLDPAAADA